MPKNNNLQAGINFEHLKKSKLSIPALLLAPFYLLYRKLYIIAYPILLLELLILLLFPNLYLFIIIIHLIVGTLFNKMYLKYLQNKIEIIELENMDDKENLQKCYKKLQETDKKTPLFTLIIIFLIFLIYFIINYNSNNTKVRMSSLSINIPPTFEESPHNNDSYHNYTYTDSNSYCTITLEVMNYYISEDIFLEDILASYSDYNISSTTKKNINDYEWTMTTLSQENFNHYLYTTMYSGKLYAIFYDTYLDMNNTCATYQNDIISTIKIR